MTAERRDEDQVGKRFAQILETEANANEVGDAWEAIAGRLLGPDGSGARLGRVSTARRRRRVLGGVVVAMAVAAAIVVVVVLGLRPVVLTPAPVATVTTSVPRYNPSIPSLVVYRTTAGVDRQGQPAPTTPTLTPERMRTDSPEVGQAALRAMFDTAPLHAGSPARGVVKIGRADITSVTASTDLIRVELDSFASPFYAAPEAHVIAQAWVRTLQDTLGVRNDVLITVQGQPFLLYGVIDTAKPLARDESVPVVRPDGFDTPRAGDVVPGTFALLGSATAGPGQPARVQIVDLDTGAVAYEMDVPLPADRADEAAPVDFDPVVFLKPGRYRATVSGHGGIECVRDIAFTVVT